MTSRHADDENAKGERPGQANEHNLAQNEPGKTKGYPAQLESDRDELAKKIQELTTYINSPENEHLDTVEQNLLARQLDLMNNLESVMRERADNFQRRPQPEPGRTPPYR